MENNFKTKPGCVIRCLMRVLIKQQWTEDCDQWQECHKGGYKTKTKTIQYVAREENTLSVERDEDRKEPCFEDRKTRRLMKDREEKKEMSLRVFRFSQQGS